MKRKTKVKAKDPDPVLGELTITSEAGTNDGCTKITVEPSLTEGYQYAYQFDIETHLLFFAFHYS